MITTNKKLEDKILKDETHIINSDRFTLTTKNNADIAKKMDKISEKIMKENKEVYRNLADL